MPSINISTHFISNVKKGQNSCPPLAECQQPGLRRKGKPHIFCMTLDHWLYITLPASPGHRIQQIMIIQIYENIFRVANYS